MNGKESSLTNILDKALIDGLVSIGDLILLEILQGIKIEREYNKTRADHKLQMIKSHFAMPKFIHPLS